MSFLSRIVSNVLIFLRGKVNQNGACVDACEAGFIEDSEG